MTIQLPDALTAERAGKYSVSIRLTPDGLSFSGYCPGEAESFFYVPVTFRREVPCLAAVKELFFANDCLTWSYRSLRLVYVTQSYTLLPDGLFPEADKPALFAFNFCNVATAHLTNRIPVGTETVELIYGIDEELWAFLHRTLAAPEFMHYLAPSLRAWSNQSLALLRRALFVVLHDEMLDVACYTRGHLDFINTYRLEQPDDAVFYLLSVWRQQGLDPRQDLLYFSDGSACGDRQLSSIRGYLRNIRPMPVPSEAYLVGSEAVQAPMDLISLLACEL